MLDNNVSLTEFDNGVKLYVNYSENAVVTPLGELSALSAKWIKE